MSETVSDWLAAGRGIRPRPRWSFTADAPLVCLELAREAGELLAADASGGLYLLDRGGQVLAVTRGFQPVKALAWSDTGSGGVVLIGESKLCSVNRHLKIQWSIDLPDVILAVAVDSYAHYLVVSLADGNNFVYDYRKKQVSRFDTIRPLNFLQFLTTETAILGAAEYGLLCCHHLNGTQIWSENLWSNVGDMSVTGDGQKILLASFGHGIQTFDAKGNCSGSYQVEGTPNHVSMSFVPKRLVAATLEGHLYWLDSDGEMLWAATLPDDLCCVRCDPLGNWIICGFKSGRLIRLDWEPPKRS